MTDDMDNEAPPDVGDISTPDGVVRDDYREWIRENSQNIHNLIAYYSTCERICEDLLKQGCTERELPATPNPSLSQLLKGKSKSSRKLQGDELHSYLIASIIETPLPSLLDRADLSEKPALEDMVSLLTDGYLRLQGANREVINATLTYGDWLIECQKIFKLQKRKRTITGTWYAWLKEKVGISNQYARQICQMSKMFGKYQRLRLIGVSFYEFYNRRQDIDEMLIKNKDHRAYWLATA